MFCFTFLIVFQWSYQISKKKPEVGTLSMDIPITIDKISNGVIMTKKSSNSISSGQDSTTLFVFYQRYKGRLCKWYCQAETKILCKKLTLYCSSFAVLHHIVKVLEQRLDMTSHKWASFIPLHVNNDLYPESGTSNWLCMPNKIKFFILYIIWR
jgi:hypothetical protein